MSLENFPNQEIPFDDLFDGCLERFGITTNAVEQPGALIAPDGTATIIVPDDEGFAQFPQKMPVLVRNAVAAEFSVDFPGLGEQTCVVIEGPCCGDAEFICRWLNAALESDQLLQQHFEQKPDFRKIISRLEVEYCIEFAPAAAAFIRKWLKDRRSFYIDLQNSRWTEIFTVMVGIGFFTRTGDYYQMTLPDCVELEIITESLLQFAETEDAWYFLHPERHIATQTRYQAKALYQRIRSKDEATRLADRAKRLVASGGVEIKAWLAVRKREAVRIDPMTAEVVWQHRYILDPYNVHVLDDQEKVIGRVYFARQPGSNIWVSFDDLPEEVIGSLLSRKETSDAH
jgi:hypothetical protein